MTKRKRIGFHRLRGQILRKLFVSFIISAMVIVIGTIIIYVTTTDIVEAEEFADYVAETMPEEIDNIDEAGEWQGWYAMNDEWRVEVYDGDGDLVYANDTVVLIPNLWAYTERELEGMDGWIRLNAITGHKTGSTMEIFRLFDIILFIVIFSLLFRKIEKYTYEISDGISILAGGEMNHRIPIKSKNELGMIASNINGMADALQERTAEKERVDRERDDMITNLAHDIRTPITVLEGYLSMLVNDDSIPKEKAKEYLEISLNKCNELTARADNIFEYVRLSNKREQLKSDSVGAGQYVNEKFEETAMILAREGFEFKVDINLDESAVVNIDKKITQRVFDNLLSNILKYADNEYPVEMKSYADDRYVYISFKNKSKGEITIEPDRMFERTVSGDASRNSKSEGLGLAICKLIMEMQDGLIEAHADKDFIEFTLKFLN